MSVVGKMQTKQFEVFWKNVCVLKRKNGKSSVAIFGALLDEPTSALRDPVVGRTPAREDGRHAVRRTTRNPRSIMDCMVINYRWVSVIKVRVRKFIMKGDF
jgi:hypothetical protein